MGRKKKILGGIVLAGTVVAVVKKCKWCRSDDGSDKREHQ